MAATAIYRALVAEIERRRIQLGWTMEELNEACGYQPGYWSKMLYVDKPSGRQARWEMVEYAMLAMFPDGYDLALKPQLGGMLNQFSMRYHIKHAAPPGTPTFRERMSQAGKKSAPARMEKMTPERRKEVAKQAAGARWGKRRLDAEGCVVEPVLGGEPCGATEVSKSNAP